MNFLSLNHAQEKNISSCNNLIRTTRWEVSTTIAYPDHVRTLEVQPGKSEVQVGFVSFLTSPQSDHDLNAIPGHIIQRTRNFKVHVNCNSGKIALLCDDRYPCQGIGLPL
ncbi:hypothetical protein TNCV_4158741 [Trichonephila clavipes]|nr:hypothetical protein TNCV_4158741 [Trichonephila clavipes]